MNRFVEKAIHLDRLAATVSGTGYFTHIINKQKNGQWKLVALDHCGVQKESADRRSSFLVVK